MLLWQTDAINVLRQMQAAKCSVMPVPASVMLMITTDCCATNQTVLQLLFLVHLRFQSSVRKPLQLVHTQDALRRHLGSVAISC
jgi:hypothetical protein